MFSRGKLTSSKHSVATLAKYQACQVHTFMKKTTKSEPRNIIGPKVKTARLQLKPSLSQDSLAGRLSRHNIALDRNAVSKIENQDRYVVDYAIKAFAKCLNVSVGYLLGEK